MVGIATGHWQLERQPSICGRVLAVENVRKGYLEWGAGSCPLYEMGARDTPGALRLACAGSGHYRNGLEILLPFGRP